VAIFSWVFISDADKFELSIEASIWWFSFGSISLMVLT
jgi:hypothetical protein